MFNKEFLKTLTIMYVEDDPSIRTSLGNILTKVFKEVIACVDGRDGVSNYKHYTQNMDIKFDAIISDINMPNMNGLEMIKEIRKIDQEIPVILTTAHGEANYLLEAIKVNVSGYTLKPIDTKELLLTIQKFCEIKKNQRLIKEKEEELSEYMDLINNIATIVQVDQNDMITNTNQFFNTVSDYDENELINSNIILTIHPDSVPNAYKQMKNAFKNGETWSGKLKFFTKNKEIFYLRCTNIPKKDHDTGKVIGYTSIGFLADDEEQEKQETMNKVRQNILEQKQKVLQLNKKVKNLKQTKNLNEKMDNQNATFVKEALGSERKKSSNQYKQIEYYEYEIKVLKEKLSNIADIEITKRQNLLKQINELKKENRIVKDNVISLQSKINAMQPKPKYVE
jgi:CheY-like chemotaxis protein